tara:strand:- start:7 stop:414 length:408 start_codon:yes stop_codon:yes gene_type:complete
MFKKLLKSKYFNTSIVIVATVVTIAVAYKCKNLIFNKETFSNLKKGDKAFILLHMNGCGHCKNLMPAWDEAEKKNPTNIKMCKLEKSEDKGAELCKKFNVSSFPTLVVINDNNDKINEYQGDRSVESLLDHLKRS